MNLQFILVEPKVPENVGAAARAIKVMGAGKLLLVNPQCQLDGKALWVAHGSEELVQHAPVFKTLGEALTGSDFSVATSARKRTVKCDPLSLSELKGFLIKNRTKDDTVAIVFGREESGLTNKEISLCDISVFIPMANHYPSLNLAQAVMIFAYELSSLTNAEPTGKSPKLKKKQSKTQTEAPLHLLKDRAASLLVSTGIHESDARFGRIMERLSHLSPSDQRLMLTVTGKLLAMIPASGAASPLTENSMPESDNHQSEPSEASSLSRRRGKPEPSAASSRPKGVNQQPATRQ